MNSNITRAHIRNSNFEVCLKKSLAFSELFIYKVHEKACMADKLGWIGLSDALRSW